MIEKKYPELLIRIKALIADMMFIVLFSFIASYLFLFFENAPDTTRIIVFIFIFLLYDPIFTSFFGGTLGHLILGIRVKKASDEKKNISFPIAILRYFVKTILGVISLITVSSNKKGKAIHDLIADSVVIYSRFN